MSLKLPAKALTRQKAILLVGEMEPAKLSWRCQRSTPMRAAALSSIGVLSWPVGQQRNARSADHPVRNHPDRVLEESVAPGQNQQADVRGWYVIARTVQARRQVAAGLSAAPQTTLTMVSSGVRVRAHALVDESANHCVPADLGKRATRHRALEAARQVSGCGQPRSRTAPDAEYGNRLAEGCVSSLADDGALRRYEPALYIKRPADLLQVLILDRVHEGRRGHRTGSRSGALAASCSKSDALTAL